MRLFLMLMALIYPLVYTQISFANDPIGRLFSTPEERNHLDNLRAIKKNQPVALETVVEENVIEHRPVILPNAINLQGYVKRNDGKSSTVWVNGKALQENSGNKDVRVGKLPINSNRIPIKIPANGKRLRLKAGQVYDPENNRIRESRSYSIRGNSGTIGNENAP